MKAVSMTLDENDIHLWYSFGDEINDPELIEQYHQLLNDEERQKQQRFHFEKHQHQYLVTRALLRTVLSLYEPSVSPDQWCFDKNDYGKPFIIHPSLSAPLYFNLSHTDELIVLAVSRENTLGVDVEYRQRKNTSLSIADSFFSKKECEDLFARPEAEQRDYFLSLWTLKEAYIKARGMGLSIPLNQFSFSFPERNCVDIDIEDSQNDQQEKWSFWQMALSEKHVGALALKSEYEKSSYVLTQKKIIPLSSIDHADYLVF